MKLILIHIKKAPGAAVQKKTRKRKSGQKCLDCQRACQKAVPLPHEQQNRQQDHAADQQDLVEDMENRVGAAKLHHHAVADLTVHPTASDPQPI